jgi:hypothetical protein
MFSLNWGFEQDKCGLNYQNFDSPANSAWDFLGLALILLSKSQVDIPESKAKMGTPPHFWGKKNAMYPKWRLSLTSRLAYIQWIYLHIFTHIYIYLHIFTFIYIYLHIFTFIYTYLHIFTCIYMYCVIHPELLSMNYPLFSHYSSVHFPVIIRWCSGWTKIVSRLGVLVTPPMQIYNLCNW